MSEQGEIANMPSVIHIIGKKSDEKIEVSIGGKGRMMVKGEFYLDGEK